MKVCIWSTSLQADTLALAIALDRDPGVDLLVVASNLDAYRDEPIARHCPLQCPLLERSAPGVQERVLAFGADIVVADNHIPRFAAGRKLVYHWHGLPLKARPRRDIRGFHRYCRRLVGDTTRPNSRFLAQCYGEHDFQHRVEHWKLDPGNCRVWGSAYSDLLLNPPYRRADLEGYFGLDVGARRNILLSLTWNFGATPFAMLGDDDAIFARLLDTAAAADANLVFSLHDRYRYHPDLLQRIERWAGRYPRSCIKFKSEHADNLADLVISDVMICNFSSFIVFHYFTGKPSIHILPIDRKKRFVWMPTLRKGHVGSVFRFNNDKLWIYPFEDNGGTMPLDADGLVEELALSLADDNRGADRAADFLARRIHQPDGATCARIIADLKQWVDV